MEDNVLESPDFGALPTVIWVKVMEYLSLTDKYHVSQTCKSLFDAFSHPSLWKTAHLKICGVPYVVPKMYKWKRGNVNIIPRFYFPMVENFGRLFQDLTLSITGYLTESFGTWNNLMVECAKQCRLESLTLYVGRNTKETYTESEEPNLQNIRPIILFVRKAFRLKSFHLESWPMYPSTVEGENSVFKALMDNEKIRDLECLSLFWCKNAHWCERIPILPSNELTMQLVTHFRNLTTFALRSSMLCSDILIEFAAVGRSKLKLLQIFVNYVADNDQLCIPEISNLAWEEFGKKNPHVGVQCVVVSRVPNMELANMLKPSCPLVSFSVRKYARCDTWLIDSLAEKYAKTLQTFECYSDTAQDCDAALISLVTKCTQLTEFLFYGEIHCTTVDKIAKLRGESWKTLKVLENNISFIDLEQLNRHDDDQVIAQNSNGEYYMVAMDKYLSTELEYEDFISQRDKLINSVSASIGCHGWKPIESHI